MSTETKQAWTPGPWMHDKVFPTSIWANDVWIAYTNVESVQPFAAREANARLISKAPEMAELLREAMTSAMIPRDWSDRVERLLAELETK